MKNVNYADMANNLLGDELYWNDGKQKKYAKNKTRVCFTKW